MSVKGQRERCHRWWVVVDQHWHSLGKGEREGEREGKGEGEKETLTLYCQASFNSTPFCYNSFPRSPSSSSPGPSLHILRLMVGMTKAVQRRLAAACNTPTWRGGEGRGRGGEGRGGEGRGGEGRGWRGGERREECVKVKIES